MHHLLRVILGAITTTMLVSSVAFTLGSSNIDRMFAEASPATPKVTTSPTWGGTSRH